MRILILNTQSVNHNNATGITMRSLIRHLDLTECMELYMQPCVPAEDALPLRSMQIPFSVIPLRSMANRKNRTESAVTPPPPVGAKKPSFKSRMRGRLIMTLDFEPVFLTRSFMRTIREFQPDCIYTLGNAIDVMNLAVKVSRKLHIPILPHFMDNWPDSHRYGKDRYPWHLSCTQAMLKKLYRQAGCALCISEEMASAYQRRHGIPHYALMNSVDTAAYALGEEPAGGRVLTYAGGLHLHRYKSIEDIAEALDEINRTHRSDSVFRIYTDKKSFDQYAERLATYACVEMHEYVPHDAIVGVYEASSVLVHIETFDEEYRDFIRYSISTKISEYLATGRAVFLYAPEDIHLCAYIREHQAGVVVCEREQLTASLTALLFDEAMRRQIGVNARRLAEQNHDTQRCAELFRRAFAETIAKN